MATTNEIKNLIINKVESQTVFDYMLANGLLSEEELYLVQGENYAVLYTAQTLTEEQMAQVRANIGAVSDADVQVIVTALIGTHNSSTTAHSDIRTALDSKVNITDVIPVAQGGTGRSTVADTEYTVIKYRGSALVSSETNPTENGTICWTYE